MANTNAKTPHFRSCVNEPLDFKLTKDLIVWLNTNRYLKQEVNCTGMLPLTKIAFNALSLTSYL